MAETSDLPASLEPSTIGRGPDNTFKWPIYEDEEARLTEMLGVAFKSFDIGGTFVTSPQLHCGQCNKLSGFDDFVHEALTDGIHSKEFILRILNRVGSENVRASPPHRLKCMNCAIYYRRTPEAAEMANCPSLDPIKGEDALLGWPETFGWTHDIKERDEDRNKQLDKEHNAAKAKDNGHSAPSSLNDTSVDSTKGEAALMGWPMTFGWTHDIKERDEDRNKQLEEEYNAAKAKDNEHPTPSSIEDDPQIVLDSGIAH